MAGNDVAAAEAWWHASGREEAAYFVAVAVRGGSGAHLRRKAHNENAQITITNEMIIARNKKYR